MCDRSTIFLECEETRTLPVPTSCRSAFICRYLFIYYYSNVAQQLISGLMASEQVNPAEYFILRYHKCSYMTSNMKSRFDIVTQHVILSLTHLIGCVGSLLAIFCSMGICSHLKWRLQSNPEEKSKGE